MGQPEATRIREILSTLPANKRLFRINAGVGYAGEVVDRKSGILVLKNPRPLHAAPAGWADLCGWETITIKPEDVGREIAVFVFEEIKVSGRLSKAQRKFKEVLERMGGIFRVHRS